MKNEILRMCVVCRQMKDKRTITRIVKNKQGEFFVDKTGKMNGRGAYVCLEPTCMAKLQKQKLLNKVFKCQLPDEIYKQLENECEKN